MTNLLSCFLSCLLHHDELFDVMANFLTSVMICFWHHGELLNFFDELFLTSWPVFDVMTCHDKLVLRYFWRHDKPVDVMACFWGHDVCLTSWRIFTSWQTLWYQTFLYHDVFLTSWRTFWSNDKVFDIMTSWNFLTTWHAFWRPDALF